MARKNLEFPFMSSNEHSLKMNLSLAWSGKNRAFHSLQQPYDTSYMNISLEAAKKLLNIFLVFWVLLTLLMLTTRKKTNEKLFFFCERNFLPVLPCKWKMRNLWCFASHSTRSRRNLKTSATAAAALNLSFLQFLLLLSRVQWESYVLIT